MTSPETALIERYLEHARVEKRLAARTVALYALHLQQLADKAAAVPIDLLQVHHAHIRRWVAQMHSAGRSGSGIALVLSCWRGFYTWLGREGQVAGKGGGRPSGRQHHGLGLDDVPAGQGKVRARPGPALQ